MLDFGGMLNIDLQIHSDFSDGTLSPHEIMRRCAAAGIRIASVTDHDTVEHLEATAEAGKKYGIKTVTGIELSTVHNDKEVHLLGYNFDPHDQMLAQTTQNLAQARENRAHSMVKLLREIGWEVTMTDVAQQAQGPIGRPHIARAVLAHRENQARLQTEKIVNTSDLIVHYLEPGKPAYVKRFKLETKDAIQLLHQAKGSAVLSHPAWTFQDQKDLPMQIIADYIDAGLDGLEVFYPSYTREMTLAWHEVALEAGLFETAGSDFHDPNHETFGTLGGGNTYGLKPVWPAFME